MGKILQKSFHFREDVQNGEIITRQKEVLINKFLTFVWSYKWGLCIV